MTTTKLLIRSVIIFMAVFTITGCNIYDNNLQSDSTPPSSPSGVRTINGDNRVDVYWNSNTERDMSGYNVYYSYTYNGKYTLIGFSKNNYFIDNDAKNGNTYFYAVAACDYDGNESDLSYEDVRGTPRPEGFNQAVFDYRKFPDNSGYSFATNSVFQYQDKNTDFFFENYQGRFYLDVWDDSDIQDLGLTRDIYDIQKAPVNGWSLTKDTTAVIGHTYIIWTWNNHYAKIRVSNITNERITFDWAYQTVEGNMQLKSSRMTAERKAINFDEFQHRVAGRGLTAKE
ncbi:MAG: hypothetical protein WCJ01_02185 [Ignavibacteria bacterium]